MQKIERQPRDRTFPVSFGQQGLWFLEQLDRTLPAYNSCFGIRLCGALNGAALRLAVDALVRRHEAFRTTFILEKRQLRQAIAPTMTVDLPVTHIHNEEPSARAQIVAEFLRAEALYRFDLQRGPIFRMRLLHFAADEHVLLVNIHHICTDGWSLAILLDELKQLYVAFDGNRDTALRDLPVQFADFAVWQREVLAPTVFPAQLRFWRNALSERPPVLELRRDRPRPALPDSTGSSVRFEWPGAGKIVANVRPTPSTTAFIALLAVFYVLLHRHSAQSQFSVGCPMANRRPEYEGVIGFFVNTVIVQADLSTNPTFAQLLSAVRRSAVSAYAHQELPFEFLVEELKPNLSLSYQPLCQVAFALQPAVPHDLELAELRAQVITPPATCSKFELMMTLIERGDDLVGEIEYRTALFDEATIAGMVEDYRRILLAVARDPNLRVSDLTGDWSAVNGVAVGA